MSKKPEAIGGILDRVLKNLELDKKIGEGQALILWPQIAGPKMAARTRAVRVVSGKLYVEAVSSTWVQECMMLRPQLKKKLNDQLGEEIIKEISFKVGNF